MATAQCILHYTYLLEYALTLQNTIPCPQCSFLLGAVDTFWQAPPSAFQAMPAFIKNTMLSMRWSFTTRRQTALSHRHVTNSSFIGILHMHIPHILLGFGILHVPISLILLGYCMCPSHLFHWDTTCAHLSYLLGILHLPISFFEG